MKKIAVTALALVGLLGLAGCAAPATSTNTAQTGQEAEQEAVAPAEPLDLTGDWKQSNSDDPERWQEATITDDAITVNWVSDSGDTRALYWAGSVTAPTEATDTYSWDSANDTSQTDGAMLASTAESKPFDYDNGEISYDVTVMGVTTTIRLERQ